MTAVAVIMIGAGVYLMYYAWTNHKASAAATAAGKTAPPPTPLAHAQQALLGTAIPQNIQPGQVLA